jgi:GPH family glycoside/pentoside/hexuronide:cation symporter
MTLRTRLGYGAGDLGGNLFFTVVSFHLLIFFTDTVGLSPALTGLAFTVARLWDAVTDPLMGVISDRTRTRWGRRRPYLLAGAPLLLVGIAVLFVDPGLSTQGALFAWAAIVYGLANTAYTVAFIPYNSLTPDLAPGSDQRTALNGYRMTFAVVGTLIGAAGFPMLVSVLGPGAPGYGRAGLVTGVIVCAGLLVTFLMVREPPPPPAAATGTAGVGLRPMVQALGNRAFLLVLIPWTLHMVGISLVSPMVVFYFKYVHGDEGLSQIALGVLLIAAMASISLWVVFGKRLEKRTCYNLGMVWFCACLLAAAAFGQRSVPLTLVIIGLAGIGLATHYVFPWPMLGSSSTNSALTSCVPSAVVRLMRCTSPPDRVRDWRSRVR